MTDTNIPSNEPTAHFTLVLAEVIFETSDGIMSRRTQFFTMNTDIERPNQFPAPRMLQLQNMAAANVKTSLGPNPPKQFQAHEVYILGLIELGQMTKEEFYGDASPAERREAEAPMGSDTTPATGDNVVPIQRP